MVIHIFDSSEHFSTARPEKPFFVPLESSWRYFGSSEFIDLFTGEAASMQIYTTLAERDSVSKLILCYTSLA